MASDKLVRIVSYLVAGVLLLMGGMKLMDPAMTTMKFAGWGYPAWFGFLTGILEMAAAGLLVFRRTSFAGAVLAAVIMLGGLVTHARVPEVGMAPLAVMLLAGAAFVAWRRMPVREGVAEHDALARGS